MLTRCSSAELTQSASWAIDGVPCDGALFASIQGIDRGHVFLAQLEVEHLGVGQDALRTGRLWQWNVPGYERLVSGRLRS